MTDAVEKVHGMPSARNNRIILDPEVGVAGFREVLGPRARKRMLEGAQL
jgi:hypothetical protein